MGFWGVRAVLGLGQTNSIPERSGPPMTQNDGDDYAFETRQIHAGELIDAEANARVRIRQF
jgi:hypothetical protein